MPRVTVRPALPSDFEAVARLLTELGRTPYTPATHDVFRRVYLEQLDAPDSADHVAEVDGVVVGFCSLRFRHRLGRIRPTAWVPDLIVTESARGLGAGRALMENVFRLAREQGCWNVALESGTDRAAAHQLYRSLGMESRAVAFSGVVNREA